MHHAPCRSYTHNQSTRASKCTFIRNLNKKKRNASAKLNVRTDVLAHLRTTDPSKTANASYTVHASNVEMKRSQPDISHDGVYSIRCVVPPPTEFGDNNICIMCFLR